MSPDLRALVARIRAQRRANWDVALPAALAVEVADALEAHRRWREDRVRQNRRYRQRRKLRLAGAV